MTVALTQAQEPSGRKTRASVLVVDDERPVRDLLQEMLGRAGYEVATAGDAATGMKQFLRLQPALVLADVVMPGRSGLEFADDVRGRDRDAAIVMMSGNDDPGGAARAALNSGAYGFLIKPFGRSELAIAVENALRRRELELASRARHEVLEAAVEHRTYELRRTREETLHRLAAAAEARDPATGLHLERMSTLCQLIGLRLGFSPERAELLRLASKLHDIDKIGVPDEILLKPGGLTPSERARIERHSDVGHEILAGSGEELLDLAATIARTHHERLDGSGYPRGLLRDEIPIEGRIAAVADVFDALTTDRVYRKAASAREAMAVLRDGVGRHFDPEVVAALAAISEEDAT